MYIQVQYEDSYTTYTVSSFDEIRKDEVVSIDCSYNNLKSLPENMDFPNLQIFDCSDNKLVSLPEKMNLPNLKTFGCSSNNLESLPENMNLPGLRYFYCNNNKLKSLPLCIMNFHNLRNIYYTNN